MLQYCFVLWSGLRACAGLHKTFCHCGSWNLSLLPWKRKITLLFHLCFFSTWKVGGIFQNHSATEVILLCDELTACSGLHSRGAGFQNDLSIIQRNRGPVAVMKNSRSVILYILAVAFWALFLSPLEGKLGKESQQISCFRSYWGPLAAWKLKTLL